MRLILRFGVTANAFALSLFWAVVTGFTSVSRTITISWRNDINLSYDALLDQFTSPETLLDLHKLSENELNELQTAATVAIDAYLDKELNTFFNRYCSNFIDPKFQQMQFDWLKYADAVTQQRYYDTFQESWHLLHGKIYPRSPIYFSIAEEYRINGHYLIWPNLKANATNNLYGLSVFVETLFNRGLYDHAEAFAVYMIFSLVPSIREDTITRHLNLEDLDSATFNQAVERALSRSYLVVMSVEKEKSNIHNSVIFGLVQMRKYQMLRDYNRVLFAKLKILLTIPSVPPHYDLGAHEREKLLLDIDAFIGFVDQNNKTTFTEEMFKEVGLPFYVAHQGLNDKLFQRKLSQLFIALCPELRHTSNHLSIISNSLQVLAKDVSIKIGILSAHFFNHSIGRILVETIIKMSLLQPAKYKIYAFYLTDAKSDDDSVTSLFVRYLGDNFFQLPSNIVDARAIITEKELDFLLFADLGMDVASYLLAHSRLALYQAAWWGHPLTSGLDSIDFFFGLDHELPTAGSLQYNEQLVRMKYVNTVPFPQKDIISGRDFAIRSEIGIPERADIVAILGRLFKFHPEYYRILAAILLRIKEQSEQDQLQFKKSRDIYIAVIAEQTMEFNHIFISRLKEQLMIQCTNSLDCEHSLLESVSRVRLVSYDAYWRLLLEAKLVLDTYPYGGNSTSRLFFDIVDDIFRGLLPLMTMC